MLCLTGLNLLVVPGEISIGMSLPVAFEVEPDDFLDGAFCVISGAPEGSSTEDVALGIEGRIPLASLTGGLLLLESRRSSTVGVRT